jgi:glycerate 2-kinase
VVEEDSISSIAPRDTADHNRELMLELYDAAIEAASPGTSTARATDALMIDRTSRVWIYAIGKAATPMAAAAVQSLSRSMHSIVGGVVVSSDGAPTPYATLAAVRGDHPLPGRHSFTAAAKIGEVSSGRRGSDVAIVLISGGASSLMAAPLRGMSEADLTALFEVLLGSGLDIGAMNAVRKRFLRWGAGRLALALAPAATHCLAISDVAGDDLAVIGSGPCVPDATTAQDVQNTLQRANLLTRIPQAFRDYLTSVTRGTIPETPTKNHPAFAHVTARVIGNTTIAVDAAAERARARGFAVEIVDTRLAGEAAKAGEAIAQRLIAARAQRDGGRRCIVWGGETTVTLASGGSPKGGGRCQELALAAARVLHDRAGDAGGIALLAAGTDGRDGATDAAGAMVDSATWDAIVAAGRDPAHALAAHESNGALRAASALIGRRETGTNVNDVVIGLV